MQDIEENKDTDDLNNYTKKVEYEEYKGEFIFLLIIINIEKTRGVYDYKFYLEKHVEGGGYLLAN